MITALPFLENQGVGFFRRGCNKKSSVCRELGARSAGLEPATFSVRSQTHSRTGGDREGHRETKPRFYRQFSTSKGTGTDRERHGVVVPLWYERRAAFRDTQFLENLGHEKSWGCQTPRKSLLADNLDLT